MRAVLKVPTLLYQIGLGPSLAKRAIMVVHTTGRRTGRERLSALNYVLDDGTVYVVAGWSGRTDWYRNLQANPRVEVQIGAQRLPAHARTVTDPGERERACQLLSTVDGGPPRPLRPLFARLGFDFDAERKSAFADPSQLTVVALELAEPLTTPEPSGGFNLGEDTAFCERLPPAGPF